MHGWVADKLGDPTARQLGRVSMNPLVHLDPFGTLMIFLVGFGWAKPVPVNPNYFRQVKRDMALVSFAGPASNLFLAFLSGMLIRTARLGVFNFLPTQIFQPFYLMLFLSMQINIALAFFNLLPIPPLDGSKILSGILPDEHSHILLWLERYGGFVLMAIILVGFVSGFSLIGIFLRPFIQFFSALFGGV
jgi:Zn-dependent protease